MIKIGHAHFSLHERRVIRLEFERNFNQRQSVLMTWQNHRSWVILMGCVCSGVTGCTNLCCHLFQVFSFIFPLDRKKEILHLLLHCPNAHNSWGQTRPNPWAKISVLVSHFAGRNPSAWVAICCLLGTLGCRHPRQRLSLLHHSTDLSVFHRLST